MGAAGPSQAHRQFFQAVLQDEDSSRCSTRQRQKGQQAHLSDRHKDRAAGVLGKVGLVTGAQVAGDSRACLHGLCELGQSRVDKTQDTPESLTA